jgi:hypothetical protein
MPKSRGRTGNITAFGGPIHKSSIASRRQRKSALSDMSPTFSGKPSPEGAHNVRGESNDTPYE